jgi:membrane-bound metal-dependent hydrolase YbcI (DUF457 family)
VPSPIGHALGGVICALTLGGERPSHPRAGPLRRLLQDPLVGVAAAAAVLPDLDFLWGRHNMETHSLGAAVLAGLVAVLWTRGRGQRFALVVAAAWASHVLFDWLGSDDTPPLGVMALWPLSPAFHFAHAYVFEAISRRYWLPGFWAHNLWAVATEVVVLAPVAAAGAVWRGRPRGPHV